MKQKIFVALLTFFSCQLLQAQCNITLNGFGPPFEICGGNLPVTFAGTPSGGTFSGMGIFPNGTFNPIASLLPGTFTITYTLPTGCSVSASVNVVLPAQQATIAASISPFVCQNAEPVVLTGNLDGQGAAFVMQSTPPTVITEFDPAFWGVGTHQVVYAYVDPANGCVTQDNMTFNVLPTPNTNFSGLNPAYCLTDEPATLVPLGVLDGTFSGTGITQSNVFDPTIAGVGAHQIIYTYTDLAGICSSADTLTTTVSDTIPIDFNIIGTPCISDPDTLVFSGPDLSGDDDVVFAWTVETGNVLYDGGDTIVVQWSEAGQHSAMLAVSGNVCAGYARVKSIEKYGLSIETSGNIALTTGQTGEISAEATSTGGNGGAIEYEWLPATGLSCADCSNPNVMPQQTTEYVVVATDQNGCTEQATVLVSVIELRSIFVPNIFTPNNDGNNDELKVLGSDIAQINFALFDRWGSKVFQTNDFNTGWDGTYNGNDAQTGVYAYTLQVTFTDGKEQFFKGNVTLVR